MRPVRVLTCAETGYSRETSANPGTLTFCQGCGFKHGGWVVPSPDPGDAGPVPGPAGGDPSPRPASTPAPLPGVRIERLTDPVRLVPAVDPDPAQAPPVPEPATVTDRSPLATPDDAPAKLAGRRGGLSRALGRGPLGVRRAG